MFNTNAALCWALEIQKCVMQTPPVEVLTSGYENIYTHKWL